MSFSTTLCIVLTWGLSLRPPLASALLRAAARHGQDVPLCQWALASELQSPLLHSQHSRLLSIFPAAENQSLSKLIKRIFLSSGHVLRMTLTIYLQLGLMEHSLCAGCGTKVLVLFIFHSHLYKGTPTLSWWQS